MIDGLSDAQIMHQQRKRLMRVKVVKEMQGSAEE